MVSDPPLIFYHPLVVVSIFLDFKSFFCQLSITVRQSMVVEDCHPILNSFLVLDDNKPIVFVYRLLEFIYLYEVNSCKNLSSPSLFSFFWPTNSLFSTH